MIYIKQLLRKPLKTLLGILIILLASAMLCVSLSQYVSFFRTRDSVESKYTTIALPTNKYKIEQSVDEQGHPVFIYSDSQPIEVQQFLSSLCVNLPQEIQSEEHHELISAFCKNTDSLNWAEFYNESAYTGEGDGTTVISEYPYTCALIVFKADEISEPYPYATSNPTIDLPENTASDGNMAVDITGTVISAYMLHKGFDDPAGYTIRLTVHGETADSLAKIGLNKNDIYIAYGNDYADWNWELKKQIGLITKGAYERCSWDNIIMLSQEEIDSLPVNSPEEMAKNGFTEKVIAIYNDSESEKKIYLNRHELDMIESCSLTVECSPSLLAGAFDGYVEQFDMTSGSMISIPCKDFNDMYARASIEKLSGSVEDFMANDENELWQQAADTIEINNHSFPVIATDNLMSVAPFGLQDAFIAEGRTFTEQEYDDGAKVCLISETLANRSGLGVGDEITMRFYEEDYNSPWNLLSTKSANPEAAFYSVYKGFSSDETAFKIIGLYRQKQEWSEGAYAFTPNTIFVPKKSAVGQTAENDSGIFYSLLLKNGTADKVDDYLAKNGYGGLLAYYDQGYSYISENLNEFFSTSVKMLLVGIIGWCIFLAVFLFMYPAQQKTEAERLWRLGAPKDFVSGYYISTNIWIVLIGIILGGTASFIFLQTILQNFSEQAGITLDIAQAPILIFAISVLQFVLIIGMIFLTARKVVRRLYNSAGE